MNSATQTAIDCWAVPHWNGWNNVALRTHQLPLLSDHHSHPLLYASLRQSVDLSEVRDAQTAMEMLSEHSRIYPIAVGHSWYNSAFTFDKAQLEKLPPLAVLNISLHDLVTNSAGQDYLERQFGPDVSKVGDRDWYERNLRSVLNWFAQLGGSAEALFHFYEHLESLGVYSAEEMLLVSEQEIEWFQQAELLERTRFWASPDTWQQLSPSAQQQVTGLKLFTDGALGARTAALSEPYHDDPTRSNRGMLLHTDQSLAQIIQSASETGKSLAVHAIGDRAIKQVLKTLEANPSATQRFPVLRIEHAQLINRDQAQRAKQLGVTLSMQPNFNIDSENYLDRMGESLAAANNPFRMLIDDIGFVPGKDLILGSDGMPHGIVNALQQSLFPSCPTQQLSLAEFRDGYCDAALPNREGVLIDEKNRMVSLKGMAG